MAKLTAFATSLLVSHLVSQLACAAVVKHVSMDPQDEDRIIVEIIRSTECVPGRYRLEIARGRHDEEIHARLEYAGIGFEDCEQTGAPLMHDRLSLPLSQLRLARDYLSGRTVRVSGDAWKNGINGKASEALVQISP